MSTYADQADHFIATQRPQKMTQRTLSKGTRVLIKDAEYIVLQTIGTGEYVCRGVENPGHKVAVNVKDMTFPDATPAPTPEKEYLLGGKGGGPSDAGPSDA